MGYNPKPFWRVEEERQRMLPERFPTLTNSFKVETFYNSTYFILDNQNRVIAMVPDRRDAILMVDLCNKFFEDCIAKGSFEPMP